MAELWQLSATEAVDRLMSGEVSPLDLVEAAAARIEAVDGAVNALPLHRFERARDDAKRLGKLAPAERGPLAGLPIAIKDLVDVEGMRTTYGCPVFADNVATKSDPLVSRLEARGGVVVAKSNTPELGMMPITTNRVFGHTRNPWNLGTTPGGSSGGASAALAAGEVWLAHGSDIGGSLRIPAAFAGVCGLRPSPGRVPRAHSRRCFNPMSVQGPMARTVEDIALFLDAMAGHLPSDPLSLPDPAASFRKAGRPPARIGYVADIGLGGLDPEVAALVEGALARIDIPVEPLALDFGDMPRLFSIMIGQNMLVERGEFIAENRDKLETVLGQVLDNALKFTAEDFVWAERERADMFQRLSRAFEQVDVIVMPTVSCPAFSVEERGPRTDEWSGGDGLPPWFQQCWGTVLTACPILAIPAGLTASGMPVGLQIVAPSRREDMALDAGRAIEAAIGPLPAIDPRPARDA